MYNLLSNFSILVPQVLYSEMVFFPSFLREGCIENREHLKWPLMISAAVKLKVLMDPQNFGLTG